MTTRTPRRAIVTALACAGLALGSGVAEAAPGAPGTPRFVDGSTGGGDPYFPAAGNGGYDVGHYDLTLAYDPGSGRLDGTAVVTLTATADLRSLSLDLRGLTATSVRLDGRAARFHQLPPPPDGRGGELVVEAAPKLRAGSTHDVTVVYGGVPGRPTDAEGVLYGFVSFPDGAIVANEPEGAATWFPVDDRLTDKATYDFAVTVPQGLTAVANGEPVGAPVTADGHTTWRWRATDPMAAYLATASIGSYALTTRTGPHGLPILDAVDAELSPADQRTAARSLALEGDIIAFYEGVYGPYPFTSAGAIVDDDSVDYALETQTRPVYSGAPDEETVAHELAHQWTGDSVTPAGWADIWLNEGFATYSQWLWTESRGGRTAADQFDAVLTTPAGDEFWATTPHDPGVEGLFSDAVYDRGAATLQALREEIGDASFFTLLRRWATQNAGATVDTADFVALAEQVSGQQLDGLFRVWLDEPRRPRQW